MTEPSSSLDDLEAFGYRVHFGDPDAGELACRWWWSLCQPGWSDVQVSDGDYASAQEAWAAARAAYLLEGAT